MDHPLKIQVVVDLAQLLIMSALRINFPIPAGVTLWLTVGEHVWSLGWR
jgi:hypothetical protein